MKLSRKLFSATAALGLAVLATVGSTYAWFSVNDKVTVTGMTAHTEVSSNLLISADNTEANFSSETLNQATLAGNKKLEPVSTVNGVDFFYTVNAKADGSKISTAEYVEYDAADPSDFNTAYKTSGAVGYVDYSFYLKAVSADDKSDKVAMTKCNLLYDGDPVTEKAWRVAVFAVATPKTGDNCDAVSDDEAAIAGNLKSILALTGATNQESGKAVDSTTTRASVTYGTPAVIDNTIPSAATTRYYKVVVRLWLEGEDKTCTNETFAALTEDYSLELQFSIGTSVAGITVIGSSAS